jgi:hypothetical protein
MGIIIAHDRKDRNFFRGGDPFNYL